MVTMISKVLPGPGPDDGLLTADEDNLRLLATTKDKRPVVSRVLLLDAGKLAFVLDDELSCAVDTDLGPLADSVWPCGEGGLRGNPGLR